MQSRRAFPRIFQVICEANPAKGPVWVSKLNVTDSYHCGTLQTSQVETFVYVVPSASDNY